MTYLSHKFLQLKIDLKGFQENIFANLLYQKKKLILFPSHQMLPEASSMAQYDALAVHLEWSANTYVPFPSNWTDGTKFLLFTSWVKTHIFHLRKIQPRPSLGCLYFLYLSGANFPFLTGSCLLEPNLIKSGISSTTIPIKIIF